MGKKPFRFGARSKKQLATCHKDLQLIAEEALEVTQVDFGITEGHRTEARQKQLFRQGLSRLNGTTQKSRHQTMPSEAFDIVVSSKHPGQNLAYDWYHLSYVAGVLTAVAQRLYDEGKTEHVLRWGGNWDRDGVIKFDQTFQDGPHFELVKP